MARRLMIASSVQEEAFGLLSAYELGNWANVDSGKPGISDDIRTSSYLK